MGTAGRCLFSMALAGCLWQGICQSPAPDSASSDTRDPATYASFFHQITIQTKVTNARSMLNGEPTTLTIVQPTPQEAIGLTDEEAESLHSIAADCEARLQAFEDKSKPAVFAARLQLVESDNDPQALRTLKDLNTDHDRIVLAHLQQVKTALGETRFKVLDTFIRSRKQSGSFFPPVAAPKAAPAKLR